MKPYLWGTSRASSSIKMPTASNSVACRRTSHLASYPNPSDTRPRAFASLNVDRTAANQPKRSRDLIDKPPTAINIGGNQNQPYRVRRAFTLVEAVVSMMMVAAAAGVFFALLPMSFKTGKMVGNYQQASSLLQHKVDQMRGVGYGRLTYAELRNAGVIDAIPNVQPYSFKTVDSLNAIYTGPSATIAISDYNATVRRVTVNLVWSGSAIQQGRGDMTVTALIAKG